MARRFWVIFALVFSTLSALPSRTRAVALSDRELAPPQGSAESALEPGDARNSVFFYAGVATNAPLLDIIKLSIPSFEPYASSSVAFSRRLWRSERYVALDGEIQFT